LQTRRLTEFFEDLNSSLAQSACSLWSFEVVWKYRIYR